jgi:glyoxylase-like metal-dependent hydrolase (beta-lactamase superfamily II)
MKRILFFLLIVPYFALSQQSETKTPMPTTELAPGVYRIFVNNAVAVVASVGENGVLLIDAGYERTANDLYNQVKTLSDEPLRYIVNTHIHGDHTGGNLVLGINADIIAHKNVKEYLSNEQGQGERKTAAFPEYARPNITFNDRLNLDFNGETLEMIHLPGGHTNSDIVIFFPKSNVLVVGDLLFANFFPYVDVGNGGNPFKYLENVQWLTENFPSDVTVVGGHGPIYTIDEYKKYHSTLIETIEFMRKHKKNGMTQDQMKEQRVLKEWETWGSWFITEDRWIDTLFPFL